MEEKVSSEFWYNERPWEHQGEDGDVGGTQMKSDSSSAYVAGTPAGNNKPSTCICGCSSSPSYDLSTWLGDPSANRWHLALTLGA